MAAELITAGSDIGKKYPYRVGQYMFHSSRFGGCIHGQVKCLLGSKPPSISKELEDHFQKGHEGEEKIKQVLRESVPSLSFDGHDIKDQLTCFIDSEVNGKKFYISCHPDGVLDHRENPYSWHQWVASGAIPLDVDLCRSLDGDRQIWVLEHKHLGYTSFEKFKEQGISAFPTYLWQTSIQSYAVQAHFGLDYAPKILFSVSYRTSFGGARKSAFQVLLEPYFSLGEIRARAAGILDCAEKEIVPECDVPHYCEFLRSGAEPEIRSARHGLCEWDPYNDCEATEKEGCKNVAAFCVGGKGQYQVCSSCINLPRFKRFKVRKPLNVES
jgi:hypothetical protein